MIRPTTILVDPNETNFKTERRTINLYTDKIFVTSEGAYAFWDVYNSNKEVAHESDLYEFIKNRIDNLLSKVNELGLVKVGNHYVNWKDKFFSDTLKEDEEHITFLNLRPMYIEFDKSVEKYKVTFTGPDIGGYDCTKYTYYYDKLEHILSSIMAEDLLHKIRIME